MYRNVSKMQMSFKAGYSPRSSLRLLMSEEKDLLNKISLGLDKYILASLKTHFRVEGLTEIQFIETIIKAIQSFDIEMPQRQLRLINAIHTIYQDITMGADELITWDMFSNYLINNVRHVKNKQQIPYTFSKSSIKPSVRFNNNVAKCIYIEALEVLMMYEQDSNKIMVMNPIKGVILPESLINQPKKLTVETSIVKKQRGKTMISTKQLVIPTDVVVMDLFCIPEPKFNVILCSTSDGMVRGWKFTANEFEPAMQPESQNLSIEHSFNCSIYSMTWDSVNQILYCGSEKGNIFAWPFKTDTEHSLDQGHQSIVMCMAYIDKLQVLASGDMDGKLIMWDIVTNSKKEFKVHNRGILNMALSDGLLLFTAGFDHQICVWNPYISGLVHKINSHSSTVLSLSINSNYLFSLDSDNQIKITNLKTYEPTFTISPNNEKDKGKQKYNTIALVNNPSRIVACSTRVQFFDYDQDKNADLSDNIPLFSTFYLQNTFKFYACTVERIKMWNILTGQLEETFSGLSHHEMSYVLFRPQNHYILVGDTHGYISMLNIKSCLKIKQLPKQPLAVDSIIIIPAIKQTDLLVVISGYSVVNVYKIIPEGYQLMKTFHMSKNIQVTVSKYNQHLKQLVIGTNVGCIELYDVENGKMMMSTSTLDVYSNVVAIETILINGLLLFIEVSYMGLVSIIAKYPNKFQRLKVCKLNDLENKTQYLRINSACWKTDSVLFLGDEKGCIVACNLKPMLRDIQSFGLIKKDLQILWKIKGHTESIIHMNYIEKQKLLITSSYDKRIKVWNEQSGEVIDNFRQQPYHNQTAIPVFYWRIDSDGNYDIRKQNVLDKALLKSSNIEVKQEHLAFNPSWLFDYLNTKGMNIVSNKYWKVAINFEDRIKSKIEKCQDLIKQMLNKKKSTKFQLILKKSQVSTARMSLQNTKRPSSISKQRHIRQISNMSEQLSPRYEKQEQELPKIDRPPKLDLISRAEQNAHKKFLEDIATIDNQLKQSHRKSSSQTHFSLKNRKPSIFSNYRSKQFLQNQVDSKGNRLKINLSSQQMNALSRLSLALQNSDGLQKVRKYEETVRIKKTVRK